MQPLILLLLVLGGLASAATIEPQWHDTITRAWPGPDLWANPAEDWTTKAGRIENTFSGGNRNLVLLTAELTPASAPFTVRCRADQVSTISPLQGFTGIQVGLSAPSGDFREAAIFGSGLSAGVRCDGSLFIGSTVGSGAKIAFPLRLITLELRGEPLAGDLFKLSLNATDPSARLLSNVSTEVHASWLAGLVAFTVSSKLPPAIDSAKSRPSTTPAISQDRGGDFRMAFDHLLVTGDKAAHHPERSFGPILWVTQTPSNDGSLRLLVQAAAFARSEKPDVFLILDGKPSSSVALDATTRSAKFTLRRLDLTLPHTYEVTLDGGSFTGSIHPLPKARPVTLAALACNNFGGFPHNELVANVAAHKPDVIAFLGDQVNELSGGYSYVVDQRPNERTLLCYLRKFAMHGWTWREILRDTPSITLPADHDVFHDKLWGCGGKLAGVSKGYSASAQDSGGYKMAPEFINTVHATQTGNLPTPIDPTIADNLISVFFTQWQYGPLDMAILADHQFKSAPRELLPDGKINNGWPANPDYYASPPPDRPRAELLGTRQEAFLTRWAAKTDPATPIRLVLSRAAFAAVQTQPSAAQADTGASALHLLEPGNYPPDDQPKPDFSSNAWPQTKRQRAIDLMKQAGALHVTGDQDLGSSGQYGLSSYRDGPWWIATPPISSLCTRRWMPAVKGTTPRAGAPRETGDFNDGFGNKITVAAVANPVELEHAPTNFLNHPVGYSILSCDPASGRVTLANWPYWASPAKPAPNNSPYPGWPITIDPKSGARY
ncbi:MAG: hypothetical protein DVB25_06100 [Verrucomicrobia bacterium]|nr:MAG: hypothetical protein DVB25_06100 [Verrucomicrobiota bacterium]